MTIPILHFQGTVRSVFQTAWLRKKSETPAQTFFCDERSKSMPAFIQSVRSLKKRLFTD
ncbi:hypothetical protein [Pseudomonas sp. NPDC087615]|uniref:hypothetical protein n=1 Tax=Pseudomonas sp. NPDC087615 TaxID=3364443 RepID=UPI00382C9F4B